MRPGFRVPAPLGEQGRSTSKAEDANGLLPSNPLCRLMVPNYLGNPVVDTTLSGAIGYRCSPIYPCSACCGIYFVVTQVMEKTTYSVSYVPPLMLFTKKQIFLIYCLQCPCVSIVGDAHTIPIAGVCVCSHLLRKGKSSLRRRLLVFQRLSNHQV